MKCGFCGSKLHETEKHYDEMGEELEMTCLELVSKIQGILYDTFDLTVDQEAQLRYKITDLVQAAYQAGREGMAREMGVLNPEQAPDDSSDAVTECGDK